MGDRGKVIELDGMDLVPAKVEGGFRLVFTTTKNDPGVIGTITLYRVR